MNSKIILVSACNQGYIWRAKIYLPTIEQFSRANENRYYICDKYFGDYADLPNKNIDYRLLNPDKFRCPNIKCSIQHGEFFDQDNFNPNDLIIWTDSDMRMQRWFTEKEELKISSLKQNELMLLKNGDNDLGMEFEKLTPDLSFEDFLLLLGESEFISNYRCFNTGVIIGRAATYKRLFHLYCAIEPIIAKHFQHGAIQQWILSYLANKSFHVFPMSPAIHLFEHDFIRTQTNRTTVINDGTLVCVDNEPVMFWHCK